MKIKTAVKEVFNALLELTLIWLVSSNSIKQSLTILDIVITNKQGYELGVCFVGLLFVFWRSQDLFKD